MSAIPEKKRIGILCVIAIFALLLATLWPFNPWPANQVAWLLDSNGLRFGREAVVVSKTPLYPPQGMPAGQSCSIELLLRPANFERSDVILSFYLPQVSTHLLILQWRDLLMATHDSNDAQGQLRHTVIGARHAFQIGKLVFVTITSGPNGSILYLNATPAQTSNRFTISLSELTGQLILGTTPVEHRQWTGEIRGLAIYAKQLTPAEVLSHYSAWTAPDPLNHDPRNPADTGAVIARYAFSERSGREVHSAVSPGPTLEIPTSFDVPHKPILRSAFQEFDPSRHYLFDVLENVRWLHPTGRYSLRLFFPYASALQGRPLCHPDWWLAQPHHRSPASLHPAQNLRHDGHHHQHARHSHRRCDNESQCGKKDPAYRKSPPESVGACSR